MNSLPAQAPADTGEDLRTARVESVAAGGAGVARPGGRVVFIPRTVPGDTVRFRVAADKGKYLLGELADVVEPGPSRRAPPCPHWAACGGCPLQQMDPAEQAEAKRRIVADALARIGKMTLPVPLRTVETGAPEFGYRLRARFQIRGREIGFFAPGTRRLVPVAGCLLVEPAVAGALDEVRRLLAAEPGARRAEAVEITALGPAPGDGAGLLVHPPGTRDRGAAAPGAGTRRAWEALARGTGLPLAFAGERSPGDPPAWTARYELGAPGGGTIGMAVSPEAFVQPNRAGNRTLARLVLEAAGGAARAADLFCGAGNFAIPLARGGARVAGVESSPYALRDAGANARANGLEGVSFLPGEAERAAPEAIREALGGEPPDIVVLDPPRRGALGAIPLVRALAPRKIVYVSCNPATLARDAREIAAAGYRAEAACIVPMFPNTAHVETVTAWRREDASPAGE